MSSSENKTRGRWGRKSRRDVVDEASSVSEARGYIPPSLSESETTHSSEDYYVTSPPKKAGLTGNISSLFRRSGSREPGQREREREREHRSQSRSRSRGRGGAVPVSVSAAASASPTKQAQAQAKEAFPSATSSSRRSTKDDLSAGASPRGSRISTSSPRRSTNKSTNKSANTTFVSSPASSVGGLSSIASARGGGGGGGGRLFYSSNADDDDSDDSDSYESRASKSVLSSSQSHNLKEMEEDTTQEEDTSQDTSGNHSSSRIRTILRFRGFSTSIQSFFLDEALVCASIGCFGLILSNRTEYLLQLRNDRRGVRWGRSTSRRSLPSRIVAYALLLTVFLISITFVVWGFGNGEANSGFSDGFYDGYEENANDDANGNENANVDDDYQQGQGDDAAQAANDDQAAAQYDDNYNNNYNNDYNNGDDQANQGDDYNNGDDGNNNDANDNGDDGNYNNDDAAAAGDDDGNNNDDWGGDDYYNAGDDGRLLESFLKQNKNQANKGSQHRTNGIFKIRDMNEGLWEPAMDFVKDEWFREDRRVLEDYTSTSNTNNDDGASAADEGGRDLAADLRLSLMFAFLVVLGILGRRRRMRTRYYLVRARAQEDHLFYASSGAGVKRVAFQDSREDQYEGACSHTLCGCYPTDPPMEGDEIDDEVKVDDDGVTQRKKKHHHDDCMMRGFNCIMATCCGVVCKCWFQCLSVCALAQEAREIRLLVPTRYQRVDYITHQPFHEYQKDVNDLRRGWLGKTRKKSGVLPHFNALSRLSRYILGFFTAGFVVIVATLVFNPRASFSWPDAVILVATFLQSFLVLYLIHWIFHKSDLSLDAVIKFFAAGFLIAVPSAFFFEGLLVNITLTFAYLSYYLGDLIKGDAFVNWIMEHYRLVWIIGELFNAYVVAAVTEELCKYYTFRCVEHPDLIFLTGLARSSQDERSMAGGVVKYPFSSHQVQKTNKRDHDDDVSVYSQGSRSSHRSTRKHKDTREDESVLALDPLPSEEEYYEDENDVRTHRQKAAAVTTGMISVAVGLACAENFLYVFLLGGAAANSGDVHSGGIIEEWIVLLFRSLFPVHALAAAMQSVNMVRKFVECEDDNTHRVGVGRIILPAVIMHGTFDAVLLAINVYIETAWDSYLQQNEGNFDSNNPPYNPIVVNTVAWLSIIFVMVSGVLWYYRENRSQRLRLILLEEKQKADVDSVPYASPEATNLSHHTSEVELV
jgi:hypothetical protein